MVETYIFLGIGIIVGAAIAFLWAKQKFSNTKDSAEVKNLKQELNKLKIDLATQTQSADRLEKELELAKEAKKTKDAEFLKLSTDAATAKAKIAELEKKHIALLEENESTSDQNNTLQSENNSLKTDKSALNVEKQGLEKELSKSEENFKNTTEELRKKTIQQNETSSDLASYKANLTSAKASLTEQATKIEEQKNKLTEITDKFNAANEDLATERATNISLQQKLDREKKEIEELRDQFNKEFKNIASDILKDNTKSFAELNETKIKELLNPLGKNLSEFKETVQSVYDKEAKERFSLGEKVKELAQKSEQISQDAINLTNALKGEAKTQGNWGEMILESILEKSGLRKDKEYFMEHQLLDDAGKPLKSDSENKKMRPDAVIKYPDNRNVIIDSKVSLNAYTRFMGATDVTEQKAELESHVKAIKNHIVSLSAKGYDDYDKTLDFVMMFVPNESAYIAAMQGDPDLWNFAYSKRILLMNPTNLITSLKLIVDLWKREYQNQNAIAIAERGAKLYDKFVGFVSNLEDVGKHMEQAKSSYNKAFSQLNKGNDNLVKQTIKLKELGVKNKKSLSAKLENEANEFKLT